MKLPIADCRLPIAAAEQRAALRASHSALRNSLAFSLIEILVVVALLSVIILGLMAMFTQTQRVFRTGLAQTDVQEGGRMSAEMISRELSQTTPSYQSALNFYAEVPFYTTLFQSLPGSSSVRTNVVEDLFFLTRQNQLWIGIGYFVRKTDPGSGALSLSPVGVGTLYRFETNCPVPFLPGSGVRRTPADMFNEFRNAQASEFRAAKILDGVVHFKLRAYDTNGNWIVKDRDVSQSGLQNNSDVRESTGVAPGEIGRYYFFSNAVPASVELEVGILENRAWEHFKALPNAAAQSNYVAGLAGRVHLFRQRVAIRNVDPIAYR
ncbi:MAG: hypothetical protein EXS35_11400 [Pedosphaera sp.]|nr:hypothetical protein [Pedosphaera sp.]